VSGDVGKAGVAVDSVEDMKILFDQIPLNDMSVSMTMNAPCCRFWPATSWPRGAGVSQDKLTGTFRTTSSGYLTRKPISTRRALHADRLGHHRLLLPAHAQVQHHQHQRLHMMEAGASSCCSAFTLADGLEYVQAALKRAGH